MEHMSLEDRIALNLPKGHPDYDPFYDAGDEELAAMVPPPPGAYVVPVAVDPEEKPDA